MGNESLNKYYIEVSDNPKESVSYTNHCLFSILLILILMLFLFLSGIVRIFKQKKLCKILLYISGIIFLASIISYISYDHSSPRIKKGNVVKEYLGYDFGNEYKLLERNHREYFVYQIELKDSDFEKLRRFCESQQDVYDEPSLENKNIVYTDVRHSIFTKHKEKDESRGSSQGFYKKQRFYKIDENKKTNHIPEIEKILEIDYENKLITMKFLFWPY